MIDATNTIVAATIETVGFVPTVKLPATMPATVHAAAVPVHHGEKLEIFNGLNFKRWQQKMLFYFTTLNLVRFLTEEPPKLSEGETNMQVVNKGDSCVGIM